MEVKNGPRESLTWQFNWIIGSVHLERGLQCFHVCVCVWGDSSYVMDYMWITWHVLLTCMCLACRGGERKGEKKRKGKGNEREVIFFFLPPWQYGAWDLFRVRRRRGEGRAWEGGVEEKDWKEEKIQRKQSKKNVNMVSKFQTKDTKQHSTFLSLTLPSLSLESSDWSVAKQPESCRNCVRETEREKHAW